MSEQELRTPTAMELARHQLVVEQHARIATLESTNARLRELLRECLGYLQNDHCEVTLEERVQAALSERQP